MSMRDAVAGGDRVAVLRLLAEQLAADIERGVLQGTVAPLARELRLTLAELESLDGVEVDGVDEIAQRRAVRRGSPVSDGAAVGGVKSGRGARSS